MANKLDKLQDLVGSLERLGFYEEAEELQSYLLDIDMDEDEIFNIFKWKLEDIYNEANWNDDWTDCYRDEEWNQYENDIEAFDKILNVELNATKYKDIVKYDDVYMFRDNVLSRRMVRGHQWLWLSNIEKDEGRYGIVPQDYINRWTGVVEKIRWMPRVQEFTLKEYNKMLEKKWIDIERTEVIWNTLRRKMDCPDIEMLKDLIGEEMIYTWEEPAVEIKQETKTTKEMIDEYMKLQLEKLSMAK